MSAQGLEAIDHTVQLTHEWINELSDRLGWASKRSALRLLRVVLHEIRDRLSEDELAQFSAQLPLLIRGMLFEGWVPKRTPKRERSAEVFVEDVSRQVGEASEFRGAEDIHYVFDVLNNRISRGEVEDIRASLPEGLRTFWRAP
ncbi:MAG: DUF2267 domain-containing protein [Rhodobacteraceae bacterium]|jgi:uncharacterized protein (DUF2267 family)|nr:DUF2267 domain-containing protein [Alphaproteobacteria bacterium]MBT8475531.1 DUF2267 domain-containing protein [Alphaproteobacteria bacterium]NNK66248.1 DUF2267 domain-containing protein [Paracoccaceae bacterium]